MFSYFFIHRYYNFYYVSIVSFYSYLVCYESTKLCITIVSLIKSDFAMIIVDLL